jgi:uncharacterized OB-fold protein
MSSNPPGTAASAVPERFRSTSAPIPPFHYSRGPAIPQGWQCPVCGVVYAPTVANCHNAHTPPAKTTTGTNDG